MRRPTACPAPRRAGGSLAATAGSRRPGCAWARSSRAGSSLSPAQAARSRHALVVGRPRLARCLELPEHALYASRALARLAVVADALCPARGRSDVVRQRRVRDVVEVGGETALGCEPIRERGVLGSDDLVVGMVLHPDPDHVAVGCGSARRPTAGTSRRRGWLEPRSPAEGVRDSQPGRRRAGTRASPECTSAQASRAVRNPLKIWRRWGWSQLRNVARATSGCVAHEPPRRTR